jgi:hypothetical protein
LDKIETTDSFDWSTVEDSDFKTLLLIYCQTLLGIGNNLAAISKIYPFIKTGESTKGKTVLLQLFIQKTTSINHSLRWHCIQFMSQLKRVIELPDIEDSDDNFYKALYNSRYNAL